MDTHAGNRDRSSWHDAWAILTRHRKSVALGSLLLLVNRLSGMVLPAGSKLLLDDIIGRQRHDLLMPLVIAVGVATLVQAATSFAVTRVLSVAAQHVIAEMRRALERHVVRLPLRAFDTSQTGALVSRIMNDAEGIHHLIGGGFVAYAGAMLSAGLGIAVLFYLNWWLTLWTLLILGVFGLAMTRVVVQLRPLFHERSKRYAEVLGRLSQTLGGVRIVKASTAERREDLVFTKGIHRLLRISARTRTATAAADSMSTMVIGALAMLMIAVGGSEHLAGRMSIGDLTMYTFFVAIVGTPLVQLASIGSQLTEALAGFDRIRELRSTGVEQLRDDSRTRLHALRGDVSVQRLSFEYVAGVPVLKDVSLEAAAGTTTALVGASGSGKSTLISLLMGFYTPTGGRILVDGHDLHDLDLVAFRAHLGVVLQDGFLFDGTVADNIRYANPRATDAQMRHAARVAYCEEFIESLDGGYDAVVGERGVRLSSGQRQRLAIARAILANPRLLLLDEATSSLDRMSELQVQNALRRLRAGRTTFVIAHRLSTILEADQICLLDRGRIVECGTHASLYALSGMYRRLYDVYVDMVPGTAMGESALAAGEHEAVAGAARVR